MFLLWLAMEALLAAGGPEARPPVGDGQTCAAVVSIAKASGELQVSGCPLRESIVGKTIEVAGPGAARFHSVVRAWSDPAHVALATRPASEAWVEAKATITYGEDDTEALQAALDRGGIVALRNGATYLVRNLRFAAPASAGLVPASGLISEGMSRIRFIGGGDARYGAANREWAQDKPFAAYGIVCQGVTFDGGDNVEDVMVDISFGSIFRNCHWQGGRRYGVHLTGATANGTALRNGRENIQFDGSDAAFNGADGLHIDTFNGHATTDVQIRGGYWHSNKGYQIYAGLSAGMQVSGVHAYSNNSQPSAFFGSVGYGTTITGNVFEQDVVVDAVNATSRTAVIEGNAFGGALKIDFAENAPGAVLVSRGNNFYSGAPGNGLFQGYDGPGRIVISEGDLFRGAAPFAWRNGSASKGEIVARRDSLVRPGVRSGACWLDGPIVPAPDNRAIACTDFDVSKQASPGDAAIVFNIVAQIAAPEAHRTAGLDIQGRIEASAIADGGPVSYAASLDANCVRAPAIDSRACSQSLREASASSGVEAVVSQDPARASGEVETRRLRVRIDFPRGADPDSRRARLRFHADNNQVVSLEVD